MSKKRSLAGFDSVASTRQEVEKADNNIVNNINIENIININKKEKKFVGVYLEPDIAAELDRIAEGRKGAKSAIVNEALRRLLCGGMNE